MQTYKGNFSDLDPLSKAEQWEENGLAIVTQFEHLWTVQKVKKIVDDSSFSEDMFIPVKKIFKYDEDLETNQGLDKKKKKKNIYSYNTLDKDAVRVDMDCLVSFSKKLKEGVDFLHKGEVVHGDIKP